jgi:hypothetical protein
MLKATQALRKEKKRKEKRRKDYSNIKVQKKFIFFYCLIIFFIYLMKQTKI